MSEIIFVRKDLEVTEPMGVLLAGALMSGHPSTVAYVDEQGRPQISHRGTLQRLNSRQLAIWVRNRDGGMARAIADRPAVAILYSDFHDLTRRVMLTFIGRAHIDPSEDVRRAVYDNSPAFEQQADSDQNGVAIVVDVAEIKGYFEGEYLNMGGD